MIECFTYCSQPIFHEVVEEENIATGWGVWLFQMVRVLSELLSMESEACQEPRLGSFNRTKILKHSKGDIPILIAAAHLRLKTWSSRLQAGLLHLAGNAVKLEHKIRLWDYGTCISWPIQEIRNHAKWRLINLLYLNWDFPLKAWTNTSVRHYHIQRHLFKHAPKICNIYSAILHTIPKVLFRHALWRSTRSEILWFIQFYI